MYQSISSGWLTVFLVSLFPLVLPACSADTPATTEVGELGRLELPLRAQSGEHTYILSNLGLRIEPGWSWLSDNGTQSPVLFFDLPPGNYTAHLESWTLSREGPDGQLSPVSAQLVSPGAVSFSVLSGTTTTLSFQFSTDGQIISVGSGELRVRAEVLETAQACAPLGAGCAEGEHCLPSELTGQALACLPYGDVGVGEACTSPSDCAANTTCLRFGADEPRCVELCARDAFGQSCPGGGTCEPRAEDYGACTPPLPADGPCIAGKVSLPLGYRSQAIAADDDCTAYVSASDGRVYAANLWTHQTQPILERGVSLGGLDLSPSGTSLVVSELRYYSYDPRALVLMDRSGTASEVLLPFGYSESPESVIYLDDGLLWLTTNTLFGSSTFGEVALDAPAFFPEGSLDGSSRVAVGDNRGQVFMASSTGSVRRYDRSTQSTIALETGENYHAVAVNPAGTELYLAGDQGLSAYAVQDELTPLWSLAGSAAGVVYLPNEEQLIVSWTGGNVELRRPADGGLVSVLDSDAELFAVGGAFGSGQLRLSRGGKMVTMNTDTGVNVYSVQR